MKLSDERCARCNRFQFMGPYRYQGVDYFDCFYTPHSGEYEGKLVCEKCITIIEGDEPLSLTELNEKRKKEEG